MNLLRLYCPLLEAPSHCDWALLQNNAKPVTGRSALKDLGRRADRIQLVIPAPEVLITRARLPAAARRSAGPLLAFAIEDRTIGEPDANQVSWLGTEGDDDVLAVVGKAGLERWRNALAAAGINRYEVHSEMLLLPWVPGEWSMAWNGQEGFIRAGKFEAEATDGGDRSTPPLSLELMLERAERNGGRPGSLALYSQSEEAVPDVAAWESRLGVAVRLSGPWNWQVAAPDQGIGLAQEHRRWHGAAAVMPKLRMAAWIAGIAASLHAVALVADWSLLASEQRTLRARMDSRFRATFPDAVAVVDPLLQMRRKLSEARHAAGQADAGDFLPMIGKLGEQLKDVPAGGVRILSYESGRMTVEIMGMDQRSLDRIIDRLRQAGLGAEKSTAAGRTSITVRAS